MMRAPLYPVFLWLLITAISNTLLGQKLDSLNNVLSKENSSEKQIDLLKVLAEDQMNHNPKEAIRQFEELIRIAQQQQNKPLKVYALNRIGNCWLNLNDLKKSIQFYFQALESAEDGPEYNDLKSRIYNNLGWNFKRLEEYEKALQFFQQAEGYARQTDNKNALGMILNNMGVTYKDMKLFDQALANLNESLSLNRETGNNKQERFNLNNISVIYLEQNRYNEAIDNLEQLLALNTEIGDTVELINNLLNLGNAYQAKTDYSRAESNLLLALAYTEHVKKAEMKLEMLAELSSMYQKQGKFREGLEYFRLFFQLSDSLKAQETKHYALELETKYSSLMKERELEKARKELVEQRLYLTWIVGALVIAILVVIFFLRIIILKRSSERKLIDLNKEIEAQAEELRQANEEIHTINENLEKIIIARTKVIRDQNIRLQQFSFMNAHKIRGPLASILGIINLLTVERNEDVFRVLLQHLLTSSQDLDKIIHEVNRQLEQDSDIPREAWEKE